MISNNRFIFMHLILSIMFENYVLDIFLLDCRVLTNLKCSIWSSDPLSGPVPLFWRAVPHFWDAAPQKVELFHLVSVFLDTADFSLVFGTSLKSEIEM